MQIKKILKIFSFGENNVVGHPLNFNKQEAFDYFNNVYFLSKPYINGLIELLSLKNKRIISIGSGFGAEEVLFSQLGNNYVDCIEPDKQAFLISLEMKKRFGVKKMKIHNLPMQMYKSDKKFDLIYSSSPSDWMRSDFRKIIPENYLNFFNNFGSKKSFVIINLYGAQYDKNVIATDWFLNSLSKKIQKNSHYKLIKYYLSQSGNHASAIASNFSFVINSDAPFKLFSNRHHQSSYSKEIKSINGKNDVLFNYFYRFFSYIILLKKIKGEIIKKIKRVYKINF